MPTPGASNPIAPAEKDRASPPEAGRLRTAHVVFVDIVGYSLLATDEQSRAVHQLQAIVRQLPGFALPTN